ncbi:23S rRNA (uracil(1939)-C(5))-methyltransferase RlmD [Heliophilum fasciatum]|uniref:23S rRNA m(5)U-1939 methyltransferase n=1 Tax=Heliophilum fasciatum TaxID=35700 RepID=A0A4R2RXC6_9FIRM|nr:23S rRNA (uracil(1939)-C(5))-methyltransferase RlmD [Heliophilum fasciatum]MCW2277248.1 23S rRNA (uracil1939-C5)-methyltransferase [Heliophilum fasciatum]TCP68118.1 23S rRNA m(5)U-1939 methyltransferase [Heliophilum fasciatum]
MQLGQELEIIGENISLQGDGIARPQGITCFVPGLLPGEKARVKITQVKKNYLRAQVIERKSAAPERVEPRCSSFGLCGGCQFQMLDYASQLALKRQAVVDALQRLAHLHDVDVQPVQGMDHPWRYRNRVQLHFQASQQGWRLGHYQAGSRQVVENDDCPLLPIPLTEVITELRGQLAKHDPECRWPLTHAVIKSVRTNARTGNEAAAGEKKADAGIELMLIIVVSKATADLRERWAAIADAMIERNPLLTSVVLNLNPHSNGEVLGRRYLNTWGKKRLVEHTAARLQLEVGAASFQQVNPTQADVLLQVIGAACALTGSETVIDAYCGVGAISLYLAQRAKAVVGIEEVAPAVDDARRNALINACTNATFHVAAVEEMLPNYIKEGKACDVLVLDPPRRGCDPRVIDAIAEAEIQRIVYVSCDPASMARDVGRLVVAGYRVGSVQPVDMFPQTGHVETVVLMSRVEK